MSEKLYLLPLTTVLFPYQSLPLNIYDRRQVELVCKSYESNERIATALIKEGYEVGPPPITYKIGTLATIKSLQKLDNNLFTLMITGERRFKIIRLVQEQPFIKVEIQWLDPVTFEFPGDYRMLRFVLEKLLEKSPSLLQVKNKLDLSTAVDLIALSAHYLCDTPLQKQRILELPEEKVVPALIRELSKI